MCLLMLGLWWFKEINTSQKPALSYTLLLGGIFTKNNSAEGIHIVCCVLWSWRIFFLPGGSSSTGQREQKSHHHHLEAANLFYEDPTENVKDNRFLALNSFLVSVLNDSTALFSVDGKSKNDNIMRSSNTKYTKIFIERTLNVVTLLVLRTIYWVD